MEQLSCQYQWREINTLSGETRTRDFLAINSNGKVPVLEIKPGLYLPESNAILFYLADGTPFWPAQKLERARVLRWMFFEQYSHEPFIAVARRINKFLPQDHPQRADLPRLRDCGNQALVIMEQHMKSREFFVGDKYSIANIALFAYTHVAHEGGFNLEPFAAINQWINRIRSQPKFIEMTF